ncbi:hypothetical protein [Dechloromonas denitrificans]|uniref:hypothetical protein n=1 Tax=Dechloromonas denitrificans TaxID=281362 RepID=UPI001CF7FC4F|nr:hypothetical protein [Dechloromonas denitrificans]UCV05501.1 hypothetical protein KI611_09740 [Dechloromonas denitrificans]
MLLTAPQIERSREHSLNNLLGFSSACFDAGHRLLELLADVRSESFSHREAGMSALTSPLAVRLIDQVYEIAGDTHKAIIEATQIQVGILDTMVYSAIDRVSKGSPWEGMVALKAVRATVESAEQTLHGISNTAIQAVDLVEQEIRQVSESLTEKKTVPSVGNKSRKKTQ